MNFFKLGAPAVDTILVEDVLVTLPSKTAVMKIDVETLECKVNSYRISNSSFQKDTKLPKPIFEDKIIMQIEAKISKPIWLTKFNLSFFNLGLKKKANILV